MLPLTRSQVHLPSLNGIRAIAALIVVVFHIDQFARLFGLPSLAPSRSGFGAYAVILFFVLSGYLITYLLLVEKADNGRVDIRAFYIRRVLRTWPLYYLSFFTAAILLATTTMTAERGVTGTLLLYGLLLSNVGYALGYGVRMILPLWSIGVEEQFYAFWPLVINAARSPARALLGILSGYLAIKLCVRFSGSTPLYDVVLNTPYSCMAIGGLMAVAALSRSPFLKFVFAPAAQAVCWLALAFSLVAGPLHLFSIFDNELNAIVYAVIIANVSLNPATIVSLEHRWFDAVGQISYGVYVLHFPWLLLTAYLLHDRAGVVLPPNPAGYGIMYAIVMGGTLLLAAASYRWFERPFLRKKALFSIIATVPELPAQG
jgi:peptidoglycan/LPS O-acetylase OafA/YrhL